MSGYSRVVGRILAWCAEVQVTIGRLDRHRRRSHQDRDERWVETQPIELVESAIRNDVPHEFTTTSDASAYKYVYFRTTNEEPSQQTKSFTRRPFVSPLGASIGLPPSRS